MGQKVKEALEVNDTMTVLNLIIRENVGRWVYSCITSIFFLTFILEMTYYSSLYIL